MLYVQIVVECHFRGSFHHNLQMKVVRTFSLRFVSYILLLLLFVLLLLFLFFLSAQHSKFFKRATKTRHKIWAVKIQHCPISTTFHMWVDYDVPNWFPTSKNFYRSPFSKWPPQYRTNSTLFDFNEISYIGRLWYPELIPDIEKFLPVSIFKMATTIPPKFNIVRFQK